VSVPAVAVRRAVPPDAGRVAALVERAYAPYLSRLGRRPAPMDEDYEAVLASHEVWVAEEGSDMVGVLVLVVEPDAVLLDNVAVDPGRQGRGTGRGLIALAEGRAAEEGLPVVRLYTNALMVENQRLYESLGYVETGRGHEHGHDRVFYAKPLG
jgi:ribosomal protein S18 acetylase RimI-like enzyme